MLIYAPFFQFRDDEINKLIRLGATAGSTLIAAGFGALSGMLSPICIGIAAATAVSATAALVHEAAYTAILQLAQNIFGDRPSELALTIIGSVTWICGFTASIAVAAAIGVSLELAVDIALVGLFAVPFFELSAVVIGLGGYLVYQIAF